MKYKGQHLVRLGTIIFVLFIIAGIMNACAIFYGSMHGLRIRQKEAVDYSLEQTGTWGLLCDQTGVADAAVGVD